MYLTKPSKEKELNLIDKMKKIIYLFLFISIAACTSNTILKKPDDLIGKEEMVNIMTDLYIAAAAKHTPNKNDESNIDYASLVFDKYQIDSARFKRSNYYYTSKIDDYEKIYLEVEKRLEKLKDSFDILKKEQDSISKIKKDSLVKAKKKLQIKKGDDKKTFPKKDQKITK